MHSPSAPSPGYLPSPEARLQLDTPGQWYEAVLTVSVGPSPARMITGKLVITGAVGDVGVRRDVPIRVGRGALAFLERRTVQLQAGHQTLDVQCLENQRLRAEIIPPLGCVSLFMSHRSGRDLLVTGDFGLGLLWPGLGEWHHRTASEPGESVLAEFTAGRVDHKAVLRASLAAGQEWLDLELDGSALAESPGPIYLMCTASDTPGDAFAVVAGAGPVEVIPEAQARSATVDAAAATALGYYCKALDETLWLDLSMPGLARVDVGSQPPWYHWAALAMKSPPGRMQMRMRAVPGKGW